MNRVVFAIPVADDDAERAGRTFAAWRERRYATAALMDGRITPPACDTLIACDEYRGWAWAVNELARVLTDYDFLVTGGADVMPDPEHSAEQIADECREHFNGTYGVMQPAGDQYGAIADRTACVSPWLGREWLAKHPLHEGYRHFYADGEVMHVAQARGRLWWREDLTQYHDHWARRGDPPPPHHAAAAMANAADRALYHHRMTAGWPGSGLA